MPLRREVIELPRGVTALPYDVITLPHHVITFPHSVMSLPPIVKAFPCKRIESPRAGIIISLLFTRNPRTGPEELNVETQGLNARMEQSRSRLMARND